MNTQDVLQMAGRLADEFISANGWLPSDTSDNEDFIHTVDRLAIEHFEQRERDAEFRSLLYASVADFQRSDPIESAASDRVTVGIHAAYYLGLAVGLRVAKIVQP